MRIGQENLPGELRRGLWAWRARATRTAVMIRTNRTQACDYRGEGVSSVTTGKTGGERLAPKGLLPQKKASDSAQAEHGDGCVQ